MRIRTLFTFLFALIGAVVLSSCSPPKDEIASRGNVTFNKSGLELEQTEVRLDLIEHLPVAQIHSPVRKIDLDSERGWAYLQWGWNDAIRSGNGEHFRWTKGRSAGVEIPLTSKRELKLRMELAPPQLPEWPKLPNFSIEFLWNGKSLDIIEFDQGKQIVDLSVPSKYQTLGLNRLELLPSYWYRPSALAIYREGVAGDASQAIQGARFSSIELLGQEEAARLPNPGASAVGETIFQSPGTVISYHFFMPDEAFLIAKVGLAKGKTELPKGITGRVAVSMVGDAIQEEILFSRNLSSLAKGKEFEIKEDLSAFSGTAAALNIAYSFDSPRAILALEDGELDLRWVQPSIIGKKEVANSRDLDEIRGNYNVLLVLFDTLRADYTQPYGSVDVETKALMKFADQGVTFPNSFSAFPSTLPSVTSLLSSTYPSVHGILKRGSRFRDDLPSLPETLSEAGYLTIGASANGQISSDFGFDRGFHHFNEIYKIRSKQLKLVKPEDRAELTWESFVAPYLEDRGDRPFFIYFHEIDPHGPYEPPPPFDALYDPVVRSNREHRASAYMTNFDVMPLDSADIHLDRANYKGEITMMDRYFEWIVDRLEDEDLLDNTLVIFVSDHGEEFLDHGGVRHGRALWDESIRVPIMFSLPGLIPAEHRPSAVAQLIDLAPTIFDLLGIDLPGGMQGESLLPYIFGPAALDPMRPAFAQLGFEQFWNDVPNGSRRKIPDPDILIPIGKEHRNLNSVHMANWKLIRTDTREGIDGGSRIVRIDYQLFDIERDPLEQINRWAINPIVGRTLCQLIDRQLLLNEAAIERQVPSSDALEIEEEMRKHLEALGYLN